MPKNPTKVPKPTGMTSFLDLVLASKSKRLPFRLIDPQERPLILKPIDEDPAARNALHSLAKGGVPRDLMLACLGILLVLRDNPKLKSETAPQKLPPQGLSRTEFDNLPTRLEDMAEEVRRVNRHPAFRAQPYRTFEILPAIMSLYSVWMESQRKQYGRFRQGYGRGYPLESRIIELLLSISCDAFGKPCYREVADLLCPILPKPPSKDALRRRFGPKF